MLYVLQGEDDFSLRQTLEEIKRGIGDQATLATNTTIFDGQQVTLAQLRVACDTVPFLAEKRLVIVEGMLERFESKKKSGWKKTRPTGQQNEYKTIADSINQIPDFTTLVLVDGKISSRNPLLSELSAKARVKSFPLLREAKKLGDWVGRRVKETGGSISPQATNLLARLVGSNLWVMANEIDKLVLFTAGRCIEEEDIRAVVSYAKEANIFALVDAILEFKAGIAQQLLQQMLQHGAAPAYILVMLARQAQIIVRVKELRNQRKSRTEIQHRLGLTSEYVLRKALEQADKYSLGRLKEVYHKLLETDLSIKTGRFDGELALNILVAELGQRGVTSTNRAVIR